MADERNTPDDSTLPTEPRDPTVAAWDATDTPKQIGPYKILEQIGEGGFGVVYLAEQQQPVRRRVALKIIKLGMDTKQVVARFEAERQALAMMDHPNVAKVFDAGATETGRPYFVMEYVAGVSITEYCDKERLRTQDRLDLFIEVCEAVQHSHQNGIIHRDIKPSNVLVAVQDGKPVPKVIDFGVAKALHQKLAAQTLFTEQGQLIGTPEYMSPEQAEMSGLGIDTRTDIYSLGVLLYGLLTGAPPFDPTSLRQAAIGEIHRIIREQEPPKPSTRLSSLGDDSDAIARSRRTDARSLHRQLRGDLDWITMMAMEKNRTRRYDSASEFAADIRRHMNDEPVAAGPPGVLYRAKKFTRRNRGSLLATSVVGVAILLGITAATIGFVRSDRARTLLRARDDAHRETIRELEEVARSLMERENLAGAELVLEELVGLSRDAFGESERRTHEALRWLVEVLIEQGKYAEAEPLAINCYNMRLSVDYPMHQFDTITAVHLLVDIYERWEHPAETAMWRAKLEELEVDFVPFKD